MAVLKYTEDGGRTWLPIAPGPPGPPGPPGADSTVPGPPGDLGDHLQQPDPHPQYSTDADLSAHVGAADPHPQYLTRPEGDAAYAAIDHTHPASATPVIADLWGPVFAFSATTTQSWGVGLLRATRTVQAQASKAIQVEVSTAAATLLRVGVYADTPSGPGALLAQTADIDASTTGAKVVALSVPAGPCWIGVQNVGSVGCTLRCGTGANGFLTGLDAPGANNMPNTWQAPNQGAALPNPYPPTTQRTGLFPLLFLQAA